MLTRRLVGGSADVLTTKDGQEQVDEEVSAAATLKEDTERREQDGEDDLDDVAGLVLACGTAVVRLTPPSRVATRAKQCGVRLTIR